MRLERDGERVRLITRGGYDWARRYPSIVEAARKNRQSRFVIDGEAIVHGVDGYSDFNALHSGRHNDEVELIAFDILVMDGDGLRICCSQCARPTRSGCYLAGRTASSSPISSRARSFWPVPDMRGGRRDVRFLGRSGLMPDGSARSVLTPLGHSNRDRVGGLALAQPADCYT